MSKKDLLASTLSQFLQTRVLIGFPKNAAYMKVYNAVPAELRCDLCYVKVFNTDGFCIAEASGSPLIEVFLEAQAAVVARGYVLYLVH